MNIQPKKFLYLNDELGIKMWNNGNFHHLDARGIYKRLEEQATVNTAITLTEKDIERLEQEKENQQDRFRNDL